MADTRSVAERLEATQTDLTAAHHACRDHMRALARRLYDAFDVSRHPASEPFATFASADESMRGELAAYTGAPLDWVIDSWIGSPQFGFTNHHLTIWLDGSIAVPHIAFAIGTIPEMFCFADLVPRSDLWTDTATLDRYYEPFNEQFMAVAADDRFSPFISKETYIREAISPIGLCKSAAPTAENIATAFGWFENMLDQWIEWVKAAEPVPESQRAALTARDALVRRTICERDPANVVAEKVLGAEMTQQLVDLLSATARNKA